MTEASNDKVLSEAIIVMAKELGIKVVAEGIETKEQLNIWGVTTDRAICFPSR
ncbi:hypothetical protein MTsDn1_02590 [Alteromonas sp. MTD1]